MPFHHASLRPRSRVVAPVALGGTLILAASGTAFAAPPLYKSFFDSALGYPNVGKGAYVDLNLDGRRDLVLITGGGAPQIVYSLGQPDGSQGPQVSIPGAPSVSTVQVAEVDGDGYPDLLLVSNPGTTTQCLIAHGNASGLAPTLDKIGAPDLVYSAAAGDLDGDGRADVVVAGSTALRVYLSGGSPTTWTRQPDVPMRNGASALALVDLDGDGRLDLVVALPGLRGIPSQPAELLIAHGLGGGAFGPAAIAAYIPAAAKFLVVDLDGDGRQDLVGVVNAQNTLEVMRNHGDGTLDTGTLVDAGQPSSDVTPADVNGDGAVDLVATSASGQTYAVLLNDGGGGLLPARVANASPAGAFAALDDLDHDGKLDLLLFGSGSRLTAMGNGDGTFGRGRALAGHGDPTAIASADLNHDGRPDIVVGNKSTSDVSVFLSAPGGGFAPPVHYPTGFSIYSGGWTHSLALGDLDGDGEPDLALIDGTPTVHLWHNTGGGAFVKWYDLPLGGASAATDCVTLVDVTGDGKPDMLVGSTEGPNGDYGLIRVFRGGGVTPLPLLGSYTVGNHPDMIAIGRMVTGGTVDLLSHSLNTTASIMMQRGLGGGAFSTALSPVQMGGPTDLGVADVNGDGILDVVTVENPSGQGGIRLSLNHGDGTFTEQPVIPTGSGAESFALGDFNGDGQVDIAVAFYGASEVGIYLGHGDGSFTREHGYETNRGPLGIVAGDFAGDGTVGLAVTSQAGSSVTLLLRDVQAVPALLSLVDASAASDRVDLSWYAAGEAGAAVRIERRAGDEPGWSGLATVAVDGDDFVRYVDRAVVPGATYSYRATVYGPNGTVTSAPTIVLVPGTAALALGGAAPNPASGSRLMVSFVLPAAAPAWLELLDVTGRRVARREVGRLGAGAHSVNLAAGTRFRPGLYVLRLLQGANQKIAKVTVFE